MLGLKLIHISKRGPREPEGNWAYPYPDEYLIDLMSDDDEPRANFWTYLAYQTISDFPDIIVKMAGDRSITLSMIFFSYSGNTMVTTQSFWKRKQSTRISQNI